MASEKTLPWAPWTARRRETVEDVPSQRGQNVEGKQAAGRVTDAAVKTPQGGATAFSLSWPITRV